MKNLHVLATDKPSKLFKDDFGKLIYSINIDQEQNHFSAQHIYITSDEEIKEGDWFIANQKAHKCIRVDSNTSCPFITLNDKGEEIGHFHTWKTKIILTTDQDLIKDGVQAIDDEFLEWFAKNPSCEEVDVERGYLHLTGWVKSEEEAPKNLIKYKINIPKEEPKFRFDNINIEETTIKKIKNHKEEPKQDYSGVHFRHCYQGEYEDGCKYGEDDCPAKPLEPKQETLEEAAKEFVLSHDFSKITNPNHLANRCFQFGAKWQQKRMYSEEEVRNIAEEVRWQAIGNPLEFTKNFEKWFEQFKKK